MVPPEITLLCLLAQRWLAKRLVEEIYALVRAQEDATAKLAKDATHAFVTVSAYHVNTFAWMRG